MHKCLAACTGGGSGHGHVEVSQTMFHNWAVFYVSGGDVSRGNKILMFENDKFSPFFLSESEIATLDGFPLTPIIGRNQKPMYSLFSLSLIVVLTIVLIIKGLFSVRMALVRVK